VNKCRYTYFNTSGSIETVSGDSYVVYDLVDRTHIDVTPSLSNIAFRFPAASNDRHDRATIVVLTTGATKPSIALLKANGDTDTKIFKGSCIYVELKDFEANKTYLIYFNEIGANKWWYQTELLNLEL